MPDQLQLRGGTTTEHNSFTGAAREVTVDTTKKTLVVHDGSQAGGTPLMKESGTVDPSSIAIGTGGVQRFAISDTEVVFNDTGVDTDFRIEGDGEANLFKVDAGNDRIGIGLSTPKRHLHVHESASATVGIMLTNGATGNENDSQGFQLKVASDGSANIDQRENASLIFLTNANQRLKIDNSGRLVVGGSSAGTYHQDGDNLNIHSTGNTGLTVFSGNTSLGSLFFADDNNDVHGQRRGAIQYDHNGDYLAIWTNAVEKVRVDSDGRVAIGLQDAKENQLLVRGPSTVGTKNGHIMLSGDSATAGQGPQIVFSESGVSGTFAGAYIGHIREGSNSMGPLVFGTRGSAGDADSVPTERLRIASNGNVGIGLGPNNANSLLNIHGVFETNAYDSSNAQGGRYTAKGFLIGDAYSAGKGSKAGVGDDRNLVLWQERGLNVHFGVNDTLAATIDVQKRFLIGDYGSSLPVWGVHGALQLTGTTWDQTSIILNNFGNNTNRGTLQFMKSKSGTVGGYGTAMGANEVIGQINWAAADTSDATNLSAQLEVTSFGVPTDNNQYGRFQFKTQNGAGNTNATRLIIDNDGVKFNGDTGANNALNDYEEGSFTPTLTTQNSLLSATYTNQDGKYTKIGNFVHFQVYIRLSSKSGGSGHLRVSNLPFTSSAATGAAYGGGVIAYTYNWDGTTLDRLMVGSGSTQVQLFIGQSNGTNTDAGAGNLNNDTQIRIFGSYRV